MISGLYDCFKPWCKNGSIWILSDLHFDDEDTKLMDKNWITPQQQVDIINKRVYKNDTFICLGDVGNPEWIKKIKSNNKILIMGNHDTAKTKFLEYFNEVFEGPLFISQKILLSHEPVELPNSIAFNIHGHVHNPYAVYSPTFKHINLAANVCNYIPVNLNTLIKNGIVSKIANIHRVTIDRAIENKETRQNR